MKMVRSVVRLGSSMVNVIEIPKQRSQLILIGMDLVQFIIELTTDMENI